MIELLEELLDVLMANEYVVYLLFLIIGMCLGNFIVKKNKTKYKKPKSKHSPYLQALALATAAGLLLSGIWTSINILNNNYAQFILKMALFVVIGISISIFIVVSIYLSEK